ncbi:MAG: hypothetical protein WA828_20805 [Coleofasciculaceae cyanobacterium]
MRQKSLITLVSILALFLGGCPSGEDEPTVLITPSPVKKVAREPKITATPFAKPLTAKQPGKSTAVGGLTQSTPPDTRVNQIRKNLGRSDPFAAIPTVPVAIVPSPTAVGTASRPVPVIPQLPPGRNAGGGAAGRNAGGGVAGRNQPRTTRNTNTRTVEGTTTSANVLPAAPRTAARPTTANRSTATSSTRQTLKPPATVTRPGGGSSIAPLPPLAVGPRELPQLQEPTLAQTIEVTGVIEAGGIQSAIVKVPNEPARYVREGERLSNGQVLVKRIEVNSGPTPTVILEQFGQEVARQVGDKPSGTPGQPTAWLENPQPVIANTFLKA